MRKLIKKLLLTSLLWFKSLFKKKMPYTQQDVSQITSILNANNLNVHLNFIRFNFSGIQIPDVFYTELVYYFSDGFTKLTINYNQGGNVDFRFENIISVPQIVPMSNFRQYLHLTQNTIISEFQQLLVRARKSHLI